MHGYDRADIDAIERHGPLGHPTDIRKVIDAYPYDFDWRASYAIKSVRASIHSPKITCIDSAIFSYGLLELYFPTTPRKLLALHRRDPQGEECGHCVTLYWVNGKVGAFSKSSFEGLGHRDPVYASPTDVAMSYAMAYVKMAFKPLYFGVASLEEVAPDIDWRRSPEALNVLSERLQARYEFSFGQAA